MDLRSSQVTATDGKRGRPRKNDPNSEKVSKKGHNCEFTNNSSSILKFGKCHKWGCITCSNLPRKVHTIGDWELHWFCHDCDLSIMEFSKDKTGGGDKNDAGMKPDDVQLEVT